MTNEHDDLLSQIHIDEIQIRIGDEIKRQRQIHLGAGEVRAGYIISQIQHIHDTQDLRYIGEALVKQYKAEGGLMPSERAKLKEARRQAFISRRMYPIYIGTLSSAILFVVLMVFVELNMPEFHITFFPIILVVSFLWSVVILLYRRYVANNFTDGLVSLRRELERALAEPRN